MGEQLRLARHRLGKAAFQGFADAFVVLQALAAQQAVVGRVLDQRVLKLVDRFRRLAAAIDQLGVDQLVESVPERGLVQQRDRREQVVVEHPAQRRCEMSDVLGVRQAIQARHEGVVERFGNRQRRQRLGQTEGVPNEFESARIEQCLGQFLGIQGHAVGAGDDMLEHLRRQLAPARHLLNQGRRLTVAQVSERQ